MPRSRAAEGIRAAGGVIHAGREPAMRRLAAGGGRTRNAFRATGMSRLAVEPVRQVFQPGNQVEEGLGWGDFRRVALGVNPQTRDLPAWRGLRGAAGGRVFRGTGRAKRQGDEHRQLPGNRNRNSDGPEFGAGAVRGPDDEADPAGRSGQTNREDCLSQPPEPALKKTPPCSPGRPGPDARRMGRIEPQSQRMIRASRAVVR